MYNYNIVTGRFSSYPNGKDPSIFFVPPGCCSKDLDKNIFSSNKVFR